MAGVILLDTRGRKRWVPVGDGLVKVKGVGTVQTTGLHRMIGRRLAVEGREYWVLSPSLRDLMETLSRQAQTVGPKDAAQIVFTCGLGSGDLVVEGGAGSGSLTLALAHAVAPSGRVISYERRADFLEVARRNVARSGLEGLVTFRNQDIHEGIEEREAAAVILDLPDPGRAVPKAASSLRPAGFLASFSPTMEQARETVLALREAAFVDIWAVELLARRLEVKEGTRPAFDMLGHTGYLTFGRRTLERLEGVSR